jgi:hypothetical protein
MGIRRAASCIALFLTLLLMPLASAAEDPAVDISLLTQISDSDIGLQAIDRSPDNRWILVVGADGYARLIDAQEPLEQIELNSARTTLLRDVAWHPRGETALLVGDDGTMLRYVHADNAIEYVNGSLGSLLGIDLYSVEWTRAGSFAYIGGTDGALFRYREGSAGGEFIELNGTGSSTVHAIECHTHYDVCIVASQQDGVGVIDRDHSLQWVAGWGSSWLDVACPRSDLTRCLAVGSGRSLGILSIQTDDPRLSTMEHKQVSEAGGEFTHVHRQQDDQLLLTQAPFAMTEFNMQSRQAFPWLSNTQAAEQNLVLTNEILIGSWARGSSASKGWIITSYGSIIIFQPPTSPFADSLLSIIVGIGIAVIVPGIVLGLIFMNSSKMQRWWYEKAVARRERKRAKRAPADESKKRSGPKRQR